MPKLRFKGDEPHNVPVLGRIVEPDEQVDVPDDVFKSREWPEALWDVPEKKSTAKDKG